MMPDDLDLMQLAAAGELLANVDGVEYRAVQLVFAWQSGGVPAIYCRYHDWATMPAARLAELLRVNDRLVARVAELELRLAAQLEDTQPAIVPVVKHAPAQANGGADKRILCDHCGKRIWPDLLDKHLAEKHPPAPVEPILLVDDDRSWRCAAKGCSGAFARDLRDPLFCTQHAVHVQTNGNGVAVIDG